MDYHRYSSLGVGSIPSLLNAPPAHGPAGLSEHVAASTASAIPGAPQSILSHHHHPSLMFHYGVGNKALPPHLISAASGNNSIIGTNANIITTANSHSSSISSLLSSSNKTSGNVRPTATAPPLSLVSSLPPLTTTAGGARSQSPSSSSFAAALRSLAKQATGPLGSEIDGSHMDRNGSPKTIPSLSSSNNGPSMGLPGAPPIVTMAPTHTHPSLCDLRKDAQSVIDVERLAASEELIRGFQPYRAPDMPIVSVAQAVQAAQLRPALPLDLAHPYSYPSLYPHHISHQYRLEEQLYLERYGLMRPQMPAYGMGGLSSLYQSSPYLATRFPPELLPTSLSALHPSNALLHERLKLEEDIRQREYELELRRERELEREKERERERGREREREREKERERRHKEYDNEKNKEAERQKNIEAFRDRSPHTNSWPPATVSSSNSLASQTFPKKSPILGIATPQIQQLENRISKSQNDSSNPELMSSKPVVTKRVPTIVRPFESNPVVPPVYNIDKDSSEESDDKPKPVADRKVTNGLEYAKPFTVWQPVQLHPPSVKHTDQPTTTIASTSSVTHSVHSLTTSPSVLPMHHGIPNGKMSSLPPSPFKCTHIPTIAPAAAAPAYTPMAVVAPNSDIPQVIVPADPGVSKAHCVPVSEPMQMVVPSHSQPVFMAPPFLNVPVIPAPPSPKVVEIAPPQAPVPVISRLDLEEKRLCELRDSGVNEEELEEMLWEEEPIKISTPHLAADTPPLPLVTSDEKMSFLTNFELTTHSKADQIEFECFERRAKFLHPLTKALQFNEEEVDSIEHSGDKLSAVLAPGLTLSELPTLKGANSLLSDFPRKSRFLNHIGLLPQYSKVKQKGIEAVWNIVLKDRLKHYQQKPDDVICQKVAQVLDKLLHAPDEERRPPSPELPAALPSTPITHSRTSMKSLLDASSQEVAYADQATQAAMQSLHSSIASTSNNKFEGSLFGSNMKNALGEGVPGVRSLIGTEHDPLLSSLVGIDKIIEHLVKNGQTEGSTKNSALVEHMEEVRRSQLLVCQTAQLVQEQVSKLISTRAQLETHRAALHLHLSSITNMLATEHQVNGQTKPETPLVHRPPNKSFNISSLTSPHIPSSTCSNISYNSKDIPPTNPVITTAKNVHSSAPPVATVVSWSSLAQPFLSASTTPTCVDAYQSPLKESTDIKPFSPVKALHKPKASLPPIPNHALTAKMDKRPSHKSAAKPYPAPVIGTSLMAKMNGSSNRLLAAPNTAGSSSSLVSVKPASSLKLLPNTTYAPTVIGGILSSQSPHLYYVSPPSISRGLNSFPSTKASTIPHIGGHNVHKAQKPANKNPIAFTPYAKTSPSKVPSWLPNN